MNKMIIMLLSVAFSLSSLGQTRSTGGPSKDVIPTPSKLFKSHTTSAFGNFAAVVMNRELKCGLIKNVSTKDTLMDSYLRLTLKSDGGECSVDARAMSCIKNAEYLYAVNKIINDPESVDYISKEFKIGHVYAQEVYDFFIRLEETKPKQ